jgi:serine/threonine protein phosphatase PrpC
MLQLEVALLSDRGGRDYNEDACGHWQSERQLCCVLADGAGGHGGGDIASRLAVRELIGRFSQAPPNDAAALADLVLQLNTSVLAQQLPGTPQQDMHSTVVCLVLDFVGQRASWAHVGDSRLYWFRAGVLLTRTRDHSLVQGLIDAGMLAEADVRGHPQRSELRSALGVTNEQLEVGSSDASEPVAGGDVFLLCTDGLWEYVDDAEMQRSLAAAATPHDWLQALAAAVQHGARDKASHDNFTALTVWARAA